MFVALSLSPAFADDIPDSNSGPYVYSSLDMRKIEVNIVSLYKYDDVTGKMLIGKIDEEQKFVEGPPVLTTMIPRAFVNICEPYSTHAIDPNFRVDVLPAKIFCSYLTMNLLYPTGIPYTVAYERVNKDWDQTKPNPTTPFFGKGFDELQFPSQQLRALHMGVEIQPYLKNRNLEAWDNSGEVKWLTKIESFEGFSVFTDNVSSWRFYYDNGPDEIRKIDCLSSTEKSNPIFYCTAEFPLNESLMARLTFLDFRIHGGRDFARERIRAFKKAFCPMLKCDDKAINAAKIGDTAP